jgi:hypothetical protein
MRIWIALAAATLALCAGAVGFSGAYFQDTDTSPQPVSADAPARWLHLYSQESDPLQRTGFAPAENDASAPAATGTDERLEVDLGHRVAQGGWTKVERAFVIAAPSALPGGATSVKVAAGIVNEPAGDRPLHELKLRPVGANPPDPHGTVTLSAGDQRQVDFKVNSAPPGPATTLTSLIRLRLEFPDGSTMRYDVPVELCTAIGQACA